ncbi:MAG: hypothetical protein ACJ74Y_12245 [Bryobacteraceae bacterium]
MAKDVRKSQGQNGQVSAVYAWSAVCNSLELLEEDGIASSRLHPLGIFSAESLIGLA